MYQGDSESSVNFYLENTFRNSVISINDRDDRKGDGRIKVSEINIFNNSDVLIDELIVGESYRFEFIFDKYQDINTKDLVFAVQIYDDNERLMTSFATDEMGLSFDVIPSNGKFIIKIPRLNLRAGNYNIRYIISEKKSALTPHNIIDYMSEAIVFNVTSSDIYGSGMMIRKGGYVQDSNIIIE